MAAPTRSASPPRSRAAAKLVRDDLTRRISEDLGRSMLAPRTASPRSGEMIRVGHHGHRLGAARAARVQRRAGRARSTPPTSGSSSAPASASAISPARTRPPRRWPPRRARAALAAAGRSTRQDIDLIVLATATPDQTFPATATKVQADARLQRLRRVRRRGGLLGLPLCAAGRRQHDPHRRARSARW